MLLTLLLPVALALPSTREPTDKEWSRLQAGDALTLTRSDLEPSGAMGFVEIEAPAATIWSVINDPKETVASSGSVTSCERYLREDTPTGESIGLHYVLNVAWTEITYSVLRDFRPSEGRMTWSLDPSKANDLAHTSGLYTLHPGRSPGHTLVIYVSQVDSGRRVPAAISQFLTGRALKGYLKHIQVASEAR